MTRYIAGLLTGMILTGGIGVWSQPKDDFKVFFTTEKVKLESPVFQAGYVAGVSDALSVAVDLGSLFAKFDKTSPQPHEASFKRLQVAHNCLSARSNGRLGTLIEIAKDLWDRTAIPGYGAAGVLIMDGCGVVEG